MRRAAPQVNRDRFELIAPAEQDGFDVAVLTGSQAQSQGAGRLQTVFALALAQTQQPQTGAVPVLGVFEALQQFVEQSTGADTNRQPPVDEPLG